MATWAKAVFFTVFAIALLAIAVPFIMVYVQLWRSCTECN